MAAAGHPGPPPSAAQLWPWRSTDLRERLPAPARAWTRCCPRWRGWRPPTWWAGRCATCCAASARSTSTWRWRATRVLAAQEIARSAWAATATAHDRFGTATVRTERRERGPRLAPARESYDAPGRAAPRCARGASTEDLAPPRLHRQRDGDRPHRARASAACTTPTGGRRRPREPARAGPARARASSTTPRGSCGRCATRPGWASRSTPRPSGWRGRRRGRRAAHRLGPARARRAARPARRARGAGGRRPAWRALGIAAALHPALDADPALVAGAALGAPGDGRRPRAGGARRAGAPTRVSLGRWSSGWGCARPSATGAAGGRRGPEWLAPCAARPSGRPPSCTRCSPASRPRPWRWRWPSAPRRSRCCASSPDLRDVRLEITGDDLRARRRAGVAGDRPGAGRDAARASSTARSRPRRGAASGAGARRAGDRSERASIEVELPGRPGRVLDPPGRRQRGPLRVAEPGHPHRRRPRAGGGEPRHLAGRAGLDPAGVAMGWQVHGTEIGHWEAAAGRDGYAKPGPSSEVDGHVTDRPGLGLLVLVADCLPVALAGPGPRGDAALRLARPGRRDRRARSRGLRRAAGGGGRARASGRCCFEVGPEVLEAFADVEGAADGPDARPARGGRGQAARGRGAGRRARGPLHLERDDLFFSHRRDDGVTGRQGGLVWLT